MDATGQQQSRTTRARRHWRLLRAVLKLYSLYFRRQNAVKPGPDSKSGPAVIPGGEENVARPKSVQEAIIPSELPKKSIDEDRNKPPDGLSSPTPLQPNQTSTSEEKEKVAVDEPTRDTGLPSRKPAEMETKSEDTEPSTRKRFQRLARDAIKKPNPKQSSDKGKKHIVEPGQPEMDLKPAESQEGIQPPTDTQSQTNRARRHWVVLTAAIKLLLSYFRHRVPAQPERSSQTGSDYSSTSGHKGEASNEKPSPEQTQEMERLKQEWLKLEPRLEKILEHAGEEDMGNQFDILTAHLKQCLLCFSIFDPYMEFKKPTVSNEQMDSTREKEKQTVKEKEMDSTAAEEKEMQTNPIQEKGKQTEIQKGTNSSQAEQKEAKIQKEYEPKPTTIKKRTMIYWWIGERLANPEADKRAEEVGEQLFNELVEKGFVEPIYNQCTKAIHECMIHPLILWMLKAKAREAAFCDLDEKGKPVLPPVNSPRACLTKNGKPKFTSANTTKDSNPKRVCSVVPCCTKSDREEASSHSDQRQKLTVVFNLSSLFFNLNADQFTHFDFLVVLHLGLWHSCSTNHIEVENYKFLSSLSLLKRLRYLSLQGMSRLTELPVEIKELSNLIILDVRGCQNLEKLPFQVTNLKRLTHLDLTECYMLEFIPKRLGSLSELQVFKGFVFGGLDSKHRCKLGELSRLRKLRKLSINITSEARIDQGEMKSLEKFQALHSLTITWGQLPTFLGKDPKSQEDELLKKWLMLSPPPNLEKLDLRCIPSQSMPSWFTRANKLKMLYIRGGKLNTLATESETSPQWNNIENLRLRYLSDFEMEWTDIKCMLPNLDSMQVLKCEKFTSAPPHDSKGVWIRDKYLEKLEQEKSPQLIAAPSPSHAPDVVSGEASKNTPGPTAPDATPTSTPIPQSGTKPEPLLDPVKSDTKSTPPLEPPTPVSIPTTTPTSSPSTDVSKDSTPTSTSTTPSPIAPNAAATSTHVPQPGTKLEPPLDSVKSDTKPTPLLEPPALVLGPTTTPTSNPATNVPKDSTPTLTSIAPRPMAPDAAPTSPLIPYPSAKHEHSLDSIKSDTKPTPLLEPPTPVSVPATTPTSNRSIDVSKDSIPTKTSIAPNQTTPDTAPTSPLIPQPIAKLESPLDSIKFNPKLAPLLEPPAPVSIPATTPTSSSSTDVPKDSTPTSTSVVAPNATTIPPTSTNNVIKDPIPLIESKPTTPVAEPPSAMSKPQATTFGFGPSTNVPKVSMPISTSPAAPIATATPTSTNDVLKDHFPSIEPKLTPALVSEHLVAISKPPTTTLASNSSANDPKESMTASISPATLIAAVTPPISSNDVIKDPIPLIEPKPTAAVTEPPVTVLKPPATTLVSSPSTNVSKESTPTATSATTLIAAAAPPTSTPWPATQAKQGTTPSSATPDLPPLTAAS